MRDLASLPAHRQAALVRTGKASAVEVVQATLDRISALNGRLEAFISVQEEQALAAARDADKAVGGGRPLGPLHGVPIALKDNYETAGVVTTAGSRLLEHHVPHQDATSVRKLREAGAIIVGKTLLSEFAIGATQYGQMRNPWDTERLAGASSGGSGAAVSAGICAIAMGSDTGGSIRIPASLSGIAGLKPTFGRVSCAGVFPLNWSLDVPGPLTKTVQDAAIVLGAIAGPDPRDAASRAVPAPNYVRGLKKGVAGLRVGVPKEWFFDVVDAEVERAVHGGIGVLKELGASSGQVSMPLVTRCLEIGVTIQWAEAAAYHEANVRDHSDKLGPQLLRRLQAGKFIPAADYLRAQRLRRVMRGQFLEALKEVDVIVAPTTPIVAPLLTETEYTINGKPPPHKTYPLAAFTFPINQTGLPSVSVPCGFTKAGLPIGMQIIGRPFDEATILRSAHAFEQATDWHRRRPPL